mmetsp:Transcript_61718/g.133721  ORF Transcript_61718/g.133721 Transcript_61718/m.133721 type:complete len:187 (+) Transcript_61718:39-599(+)
MQRHRLGCPCGVAIPLVWVVLLHGQAAGASLQLRGEASSVTAARAGPAPAPAPAAAAAAGPTVAVTSSGEISSSTCETLVGEISAIHCELYTWEDGLGSGCACYLEGSHCPEAPGAEAMGFTGGVVATRPLSLPELGTTSRISCFYRRWVQDPDLSGPLHDQQLAESKQRILQYISTAFENARAKS